MKYIYKSHLTFILLFIALAGNCATSDLEIIRNKVIAGLMKPPVDEAQARALMASVHPDGTWPGINYADVSKTGFQHREHLYNLVTLGRAYQKKGTKLKGDPKLKKVIFSALDYWLANDFICENWWWNQIGTPNKLVSFLLIMDTNLTKEQISGILPMVGRAYLNATGARPSGDRIKIAGILAKTLLFKRDEAQFNDVVQVIEGEIKFSTERGMQYDYSFHHRVDKVNNTLSYGTGYADAFAEWAALAAGTRYQFSAPSLHQLTDYYLDGICKMTVNGRYIDPGAMNRDISRADEHKAIGTATIDRLMAASGYRENELATIKKIREGEPLRVPPHASFFWQSEYFTIQRPDFFTSVRMYSSRDCNMEEPYNGEGLMNHHRGDGTNYISRTGEEYNDIAPVYDWQKIPGTTVVQKPALPSEKEIQKQGLTDFVGAATDGIHGVVVFDFKSPHDPLKAKKSWFFFEKEYVCLGTGITSESQYPVATTLNQCLLKGKVLMGSNGTSAEVSKGTQDLSNVQWILHDGIGYIFPEPAKLSVSCQEESGSWYKINHQSDSPKETVSRDVFKLWFNHGAKPENAGYKYIVVPGITEQELIASAGRNIEILANTAEIQAVSNKPLNICEIVFYQAGQVQISDRLKLSIDSPGLVIAKTDGTDLKSVSVEDPSRKLSRIHLSVNTKIVKTGASFSSWWNEEKGISEITFDLLQTVYAGKSVTIDL